MPFGKISRATALRGALRPWRRSSGRPRMLRLASQVSCAASLSRLRAVAEIDIAKPFGISRAILPSQSAQMVDIGNDPIAGLSANRRNHGHAAGRHVYNLAGKFAPVGEHVAAQQIDLHALEAATFVGAWTHLSFS